MKCIYLHGSMYIYVTYIRVGGKRGWRGLYPYILSIAWVWPESWFRGMVTKGEAEIY